MKLKNKTYNIITIEVTKKELDDLGFDRIWDEIRETCSSKEYETEEIKSNGDGTLIYINLKYNKDLKTIGGL